MVNFSCRLGAASTMPAATSRMAASTRNTPLSSPAAKPAVATNSAIAVKEIASPAASAAGASLCSDAAEASTMGRIGNTQGDSVDNAPAANKRPRLAALMASESFCEQGLDGRLAGVANRAANLGFALEDNQCALALHA